jgi:type I restriction enzyme S subunit
MDEWPREVTTPLKYLARVIAGQAPPSDAVSDLTSGLAFVQGNAEFGPAHPRPTLQCDRAPKVAVTGDILLSVRAPVGAINVADQALGIGRGLAAIRPNAGTDGRYLRYVISSLISALRSLSTGTTYEAITADDISGLLVPRVSADEQRRIADFLDDQVARIDNIIAARRSQRRLFAERSAGLLQDVLADSGCVVRAGAGIDGYRQRLPAGWRVGELGHVLRQLTNGYVGPTRDLLVDDGVRYIQSLHIKNGRIDFARRPYYVPRAWHLERPRIHLRPDDVLIVQTGDIGQIAVVPEDIGDASCHALLIARAEPGVVTGKFLGEYLRTPAGQQELLSRATGALHPHLESGIKAAPVIVPPDDAQRRAVAEVRARRAQLENLDAALARSNAELAELKRSLITAAVTGEFDVSTTDGCRVLA